MSGKKLDLCGDRPLSGQLPVKSKVLYVRNVHRSEEQTDDNIIQQVKLYTKEKGVHVVAATVVKNHFADDIVGCRVTVPRDDAVKLLEVRFWPEPIKCREWKTKGERNGSEPCTVWKNKDQRFVRNRPKMCMRSRSFRTEIDRRIITTVKLLIRSLYMKVTMYVYLLVILTLCCGVNHCLLVMSVSFKNPLKIIALNMHGFHENKLYLRESCNAYIYDVVAVSMHWLYPAEYSSFRELLGGSYHDIFKTCKDMHPGSCGKIIGHAGTALCWKLHSRCSKGCDVESDRFCILCINIEQDVMLFIVSVYMPQANSNIADFGVILDQLEEIVLSLREMAHVCYWKL